MDIKWDANMTVGNTTLDIQHKRMIDQINKILGALTKTGWEMSTLRQTLGFLTEYAQQHFTAEEKYMIEIKYPGLDEHKQVHEEFKKFFQKFQEDFANQYSTTQSKTLLAKKFLDKTKKYLGEWLINHILTEDHKYYEYAMKKKR